MKSQEEKDLNTTLKEVARVLSEGINSYSVSENTVDGAAPNIAGTDEIINKTLFTDYSIKSLASDLFPTVKLGGPSGAFVNVKKAGVGKFELKRKESTVYDSKPIKTGITKEAFEDLINMYGFSAGRVVSSMFSGTINDDINTKTQEFLDANSTVTDPLTLSPEILTSSEKTAFAIIKRVGELVHKASETADGANITRKAYCLMPYEYSSAFELLNIQRGSEAHEDSNIVLSTANTVFVQNPNPGEKSIYIGLRDIDNVSQSAVIYSPYSTTIQAVMSSETGDTNYHIFNRFALGLNPLHTSTRSLMWKFEVN